MFVRVLYGAWLTLALVTSATYTRLTNVDVAAAARRFL